MGNRVKINAAVSTVIAENNSETIDRYIVEDYEKLNKKCEEVIEKIKIRKVKKISK